MAETPVQIGLLLIGYLIVGIGIKIADLGFDDRLFDTKKSAVLAAFIALLAGGIAVVDETGFLILTGLFLGSAFKKKIDNWPFRISACFFVLLIAYKSTQLPISIFDLFAIGCIGAAAYLDEVINDWNDEKKFNFQSAIEAVAVNFGVVKITVFLFYLLGTISITGIAGILLLDGGYFETAKLNTRKKWKALWKK